jgi:hypothetical protein
MKAAESIKKRLVGFITVKFERQKREFPSVMQKDEE